MKILIVNTLYYPIRFGGAEKSIQILAESLCKAGHNVNVLTLNKNKDKTYHTNSVKVHSLKIKNIYWPFEKSKKNKFLKHIWHYIDTYLCLYKNSIKQIVKNEQPDIIHVNNISGFGSSTLYYLKTFGKPIVVTIRDYHYLCLKNTCFDNSNCNDLCKTCKLTSVKKLNNLNNNATHIVGISDYILKKYFKHGLSAHIKSSIIYNSVNNQIKNKKQRKDNKKNIVFGFIGSIYKSKGIEDLLELFTSNEIKSYNILLKIAGEGEKNYVEGLKAKYNSKKINFVGFQNSSNFYNSIDALIIPSKWQEPFGRTVIEGASFGLPIFVSPNGALIELKDELKNIKWFNKTNVLEFLKNNTYRRLEYDLSKFSPDVIAKEYEDLYIKLTKHEG